MDNHIVGKVLSSRNYQGIPDLLVVLYDIDAGIKHQQNQPYPNHSAPLTHLTTSHIVAKTKDGTQFVFPNTAFNRRLAQLIENKNPADIPVLFRLALALSYGGDDDILPQVIEGGTADNFTIEQATRTNSTAWIDFPGDRIGSVLTTPEGKFHLAYDDDAFQVSAPENRPDLVLFVLGPDRSRGIGVLDRLLHFAYVPRENAGRTESFIIHIDEDILEKYGVPGRLWTPPPLSDLKTRLADNRESRLRDRTLFDGAFRWFTPLGLSSSPRFVPPGLSVSVPTIQGAIERGVGRLARATVRPVILHLEPSDFEALGLSAPTTSVSLSTQSPCDLMKRKGLGTELQRFRDLLVEHKSNQVVESLSTTSSTDTTPSPPTPTPALSPFEFLEEKALAQVADYPSLPDLPKHNSKTLLQELQDLKQHINELEFSSGPANVTAFRDFHALQIAFEDVWTSAFDERIKEEIRALYRETTRLDEDYGLEFPNLEGIEDANALIRYLNSIRDVADEAQALLEPVPRHLRAAHPRLTEAEWNRLSPERQEYFSDESHRISFSASYETPEERQAALDAHYDYYIRAVGLNGNPLSRIARMTADINEKLNEPYAFNYYAPNTVNYGIVTSYRQEWLPQNYQVGRLISTLPLAPGESRELKVKHHIKRTRAEKEMRKALSENSFENSSTVRSELDVIAKLSTESNFKLGAQGTFNIGIGSITSTSEFSHDQKAESSKQQKQFAEATRKAAEKVRQERETTVEVSEEIGFESESTQKISNPNDEVTVTYLVYELERRYQVTHRLNKVTPVIMVAMDMPSPHEITEGWILEHAWIIRRVLLDDAFHSAIDIIENGRTADVVDIEVKKALYEKEKELLDRVEADMDAVLADRRSIRETVIGLTQQKAEHDAGEDVAGDVGDFFLSGGFSALFRDRGPDEGELIQAQMEAAKSRMDYIEQSVEEMGARLRSVRRSAREAGEQYTQALKHQARMDSRVQQLRLHLRQNIFHYMHAIWESKHEDELLFRFVDLEVPFVEPAVAGCTIRPARPDELPLDIPGIPRRGTAYAVECPPPAPPSPLPTRRLGQIANLGQLLGFKGNYAIYPLRECSQITDFMMQEFVDDYVGVRDPANGTGFTTPELVRYATEIWSELEEPEQSALRQLLVQRLTSTANDTETIILPTGQLYMEALKGEQALLEDFKLAHRGLDVLKVQEEIREERIENVRRVFRLIGEDRELSDEIDKKILVEGVREPVVKV